MSADQYSQQDGSDPEDEVQWKSPTVEDRLDAHGIKVDQVGAGTVQVLLGQPLRAVVPYLLDPELETETRPEGTPNIGILPGPEEQGQLVQTAIQRIKAGETGAEVKALVVEAGECLVRRGVEVLVAGCTELPLVFGSHDASVPVIDPSQVLAEATIAAVNKASQGHRDWKTAPHVYIAE